MWLLYYIGHVSLVEKMVNNLHHSSLPLAMIVVGCKTCFKTLQHFYVMCDNHEQSSCSCNLHKTISLVGYSSACCICCSSIFSLVQFLFSFVLDSLSYIYIKKNKVGLQRYIFPWCDTYLPTRATIRYMILYITVRDKTSYQQLTRLK